MSYWSFTDGVQEGELIVHRRWARPVLRVFAKLFAARFPVRRIVLPEEYGSNDDRLGYADVTSGFNCRFVKGTRSWSEHAYGRAIDVNPRENPFVAGRRVSPPAGRKFLDRHRWQPGMVHAGDRVVRAFAAIGWRWGGYWKSSKDFMHFSATGR
jgi:D-alanyl-D-alanine carboxypeptidase